ncbi:MAG: hypothetical protein WD648_12550 [Planctomycetaceae bacterium]
MKKIIALLAFAGISLAFSGCSPDAAGPGKGTNGAVKPDLGEPGSAVDMHDDSKGKTTDSKPAPATADDKKPAPTQEPAAEDSKADAKPTPEPADKAEKTDAKKSDLVDDKTDDKDEEEQK